MYEMCQRWGIPAAGAGIGWAGSRNHAPNENVRLEDLRQGIKHIALIMEAFALAQSAGQGAGQTHSDLSN
jgi:acetylornithine deacetylase/succinyl-diaminopimelate desuccinylase-like protein